MIPNKVILLNALLRCKIVHLILIQFYRKRPWESLVRHLRTKQSHMIPFPLNIYGRYAVHIVQMSLYHVPDIFQYLPCLQMVHIFLLRSILGVSHIFLHPFQGTAFSLTILPHQFHRTPLRSGGHYGYIRSLTTYIIQVFLFILRCVPPSADCDT